MDKIVKLINIKSINTNQVEFGVEFGTVDGSFAEDLFSEVKVNWVLS